MNTEGISPFTVSQWQELEHQALIFKYLIAGLSVPPDLVFPIQNSFQTSPSFLGYCGRESSMYGIGIGVGYGKKIDPEPGRCRRTDGKKWRCSKEAYPDSKYCERHMHRGRSRSRKPVESHSLSSSSSLSLSSFPSVSAAALTLNQTQSFPLKFNALASANANALAPNSNHSSFQLDSIPYAIPTKNYSRHLQGVKPDAGDSRAFSECSGGNRSLLMDSGLDNTWSSLSPQMSLFSPSKPVETSSMCDDYGRRSLTKSEFDTPLNKSEFDTLQPVKHGSQSLRPFFEEWPKTRAEWPGLAADSVNQVSFSATQLSISVPMATSGFSTGPKSS